MQAGWTAVLLTAAGILALIFVALKTTGVLRILLIVQSGYWAISYVGRPLLLLYVNPTPRFADSIADPRLLNPTFSAGLDRVLWPAVFGIWFYALLVASYVTWKNRRSRIDGPIDVGYRTDWVRCLVVVYCIGLVVRLGLTFLGENPVLTSLAYLASIGAVGLIVYIKSDKTWQVFSSIASVAMLEFIWTLFTASKTPILAVVLAIALRFAINGWNRRNVALVLLVSICSLGGFARLQSVKLSSSTDRELDLADSTYPVLVQPILPILRRFDLLSALTDSHGLGAHQWLSSQEALLRLVQSLIPQQLLGIEKLTAGRLWTLEVRGYSIPTRASEVSLAEGVFGEGYALAGYLGVAIGCLYLASMLAFVAYGMQNKSVFLRSVSLVLVSYPVLFERGLFGGTEVLGKSLQAAVVVWLIFQLVRGPRVRDSEIRPVVRTERKFEDRYLS